MGAAGRRSTQALFNDLNEILAQAGCDIRIVCRENDQIVLNDGTRQGRNEWAKLQKRCYSELARPFLKALYSPIDSTRQAAEQELRYRTAQRGGRALMSGPHRDKVISRATQNVLSTRENGTARDFVRGQVPWNKGRSKATCPLMKRLSEDRQGIGNPMFGKSQPPESRSAKSASMRLAIAQGRFTPRSSNRLTHRQLVMGGQRYRSTWELVFHLANPSYQYEVLRFRYEDPSGKQCIYIVDFVDPVTKTIFEVKPRKIARQQALKIAAAQQWASSNGYTFVMVDDPIIAQYVTADVLAVISDIITGTAARGLRRLHEAYFKADDFAS